MRNHRSSLSGLFFAASMVPFAGCGDDGSTMDMADMAMAPAPDMAFKVEINAPECTGVDVKPLKGSRQMVISELSIGDFNEGFDFDGDKKPNNMLAPLGAVANAEIAKNFSE